MIGNNIFYTFFLSNLEIKFLKKKNPTNESYFDTLLKHEISKRRMIDEEGGFDPTRYGQNFLSSWSEFSKANTIAKNSISVIV